MDVTVEVEETGGSETPEPVPERRWEGEETWRWTRWWGIPSFRVFHTLASTNETLREAALAGAEPFSVVVAETQTRGRGREGRSWHSPPGLGLWASVLLEGTGGNQALPILPLRVGLALARAVEAVSAGGRASIKWPNDLMLEGRKAGGILCEVVPSPGGEPRVVAGVGVNLGQEPSDFPVDLRRSAVSVAQVTGMIPDRALLLGTFLSLLRDTLESGVGGRLEESELEELRSRDLLRGRLVRVDPGGEGIARGIDDGGALLLEDSGGRVRRLTAGSVRILDRGPASGDGERDGDGA